jgi:hypothetical protein
MTEESSKQVARENFSMSTVSMLQAASFEPLLHQLRDEEEEGWIEFHVEISMNENHFSTYR